MENCYIFGDKLRPNLRVRGKLTALLCILVRVSTAVKIRRDYRNLVHWSWLQVQRFSPLWLWWYAGRHGAEEGTENLTFELACTGR